MLDFFFCWLQTEQSNTLGTAFILQMSKDLSHLDTGFQQWVWGKERDYQLVESDETWRVTSKHRAYLESIYHSRKGGKWICFWFTNSIFTDPNAESLGFKHHSTVDSPKQRETLLLTSMYNSFIYSNSVDLWNDPMWRLLPQFNRLESGGTEFAQSPTASKW